jgi:hypothetical protein
MSTNHAGILACSLALSLSGAVAAQESGGCHTTKTFGSALSLFRICISEHGNLQELTSPQAMDRIYNEGYAVCSQGNQSAWDMGYLNLETTWGFTHSTAPNVWPKVVTRESADGKFELKQKFTWDPGRQIVEIEMQLKNISGATQANVILSRLVDANPDFDPSNDKTDRTVKGIASTGIYGLLLSTPVTGNNTGTSVHNALAMIPGQCTQLSENAPYFGNGAGRLNFVLGALAPGVTKTVKVKYQPY